MAEVRSIDPAGLGESGSALLREALLARADAEAAQVRADDAREEAEQAREEAERARARIWLLAEAGRRMAQSLDWKSVVQAIARSGVPAVADWASLAVVEDGQLRVVAVAHSEPERERLAWDFIARHPPGGLGANPELRPSFSTTRLMFSPKEAAPKGN